MVLWFDKRPLDNNTTDFKEDITMASINIKNLLGNGEMAYDKIYTEGPFEWFKFDDDGYIYVRNSETGRNTRYNGEAQNGKRISDEEYFTKCNEVIARAEEAFENELTDDQIERALEEVKEAAQGTEEAHEVAPAPKAKKRAKKTAAYTFRRGDVEVTLTEKQVDFIRHLPDTCFWERGVASIIWVDVLCDEIGGQFKGKPMTVGAMISTICEKGLGERSKDRNNGRKCTAFALTGLGQMVARDLGLK